jgi:hypothetical protein
MKRTVSKGAKRAKAAAEMPAHKGKGVRTTGKLALSAETIRNLRAKTGLQAGAAATGAKCYSNYCNGATATC